jgi:hypothetical protein
VDAHHPDADGHGTRRAALGLGVVVALVAVAGLTISMLQPRTAAVRSVPPGSTSAFEGPLTGLDFSVADDLATRQVVLFGGIDSADTTWLWDGDGGWSAANPRASPPGRSGAAAAYDPLTQDVMLYGGSLASGKSADDTWAWDGTTWFQVKSDASRPPPGAGALMAWDTATLEMVLVTDAESGTGAETWIWNVSHWTRQTGGDLSISVSGDVMAYDPTGQALLLVTPNLDNGYSLALQWSGSSWRLLDSDGPDLEGMAADPRRNVLIACGTATYSAPSTVQASCWEWATTSWRQLDEAVIAPDSRQVIIEVEVDDVEDSRVLMFGWLTRAIPGQPQPLHIWWWDDGVWALLA